ncbi:type II toxin-antitoxin system VapC family toxin [Thermococcus sp. JdF3]|uniref:type II toxin-antitoxin system VapC family toxin n=1 Tax=Thermococcus sp. JdF3 TaxID=1638258 RepID=UPI0014391CC0|nr:type II toxin-antitoxin system VapC family toxin [Thermococcus sp. JdF3]NJE00480.1 PIN domain-containing protein [Thermococcus sp. JdF3]
MRVVLDTSILAKALLKPRRSLPPEVYTRESNTHKKARLVVKLCDGHDVMFPRAGLVEIASVLKRNGHGAVILKVIESISISYTIVDEDEIFENALEVASLTGASGFDTYFIALAKSTDALLITDDVKMSKHALAVGINVLLLREASEERIREVLKP